MDLQKDHTFMVHPHGTLKFIPLKTVCWSALGGGNARDYLSLKGQSRPLTREDPGTKQTSFFFIIYYSTLGQMNLV